MKSTIKITGTKAEGKHGANPGEQDAPQAFIVDLKIKLEVGSDAIDQTVDYETLASMVKNHIANNSYQLIETLAYNIAAEIKNLEKVNEVTVTVHKPSAAGSLGAEGVSATAKVEGAK